MGGLGSIISGAVGGLAKMGVQLYGAVQGARAGKKGLQERRDAHDRYKDYYNGLINQDYVNRSEIQGLLNKSRQMLQDRYNTARATNIVGGGTDESLAMMQDSANQALADAISSTASNASQYKDKLTQSMMAEEQQYGKDMADLQFKRADQIAKATEQATKAIGDTTNGFMKIFTPNPAQSNN